MGQLRGTNQVNSFPGQGRMNEDGIEDRYLSVNTMRITRTIVNIKLLLLWVRPNLKHLKHISHRIPSAKPCVWVSLVHLFCREETESQRRGVSNLFKNTKQVQSGFESRQSDCRPVCSQLLARSSAQWIPHRSRAEPRVAYIFWG